MSDPGLLLAIESSTTAGSIALGGVVGVVGEFLLNVRGTHSSALLPAADQLLKAAGVTPRELDGIVVGAGPGSFTGIRIAGATAKGMAHALSLPIFAYSSLMVAAASLAEAAGGRPACAMFDARGRDVFAACYRFDSEVQTVFGPDTLLLNEAIDLCRSSGVVAVTGDAVLRHANEIAAAELGLVADGQRAYPRAADLLWLAARFPEAGRVSDAAAWEPTYLRPSGAERIAADRAVREAAG